MRLLLAVARHLMPMLTDSARVAASISDRSDISHNYTFSLQPSDEALAAIIRHCVSDVS